LGSTYLTLRYQQLSGFKIQRRIYVG